MSKRGYITRYTLILTKLKSKPYSTYDEIQSYIDNTIEYRRMNDETLNVGFSKRTLQRDMNEIKNLFGVSIEYSVKNKGYFISEGSYDNKNFERMIEAFDLFNSLNMAQDLSRYIYLEKRKPKGTENLYGILHAIKNRVKIKFSYFKFWDDTITERIADPLGLKEFKNRWYVIAKDKEEGHVKSFALDRISDFEITNNKFKYPAGYNVEDSFKHCFGMTNLEDETPEEIILSFDPYQANYIKTMPLHESQEIILENDKEVRIQLKLNITHELIMELLSYGNNLKVLQPKVLIDEIKAEHQKAFKQYK